jgi:hypothetical protein
VNAVLHLQKKAWDKTNFPFRTREKPVRKLGLLPDFFVSVRMPS